MLAVCCGANFPKGFLLSAAFSHPKPRIPLCSELFNLKSMFQPTTLFV